MSCSASKTSLPAVDLPVISVNGVGIDRDYLSQIVQYYPANSLEEAIEKGAQTLTIQTLLSQLSGLSIHDEKKLMAFVEQQVAFEEVSNADCQRFFDNNREKFRTSPLLVLRHILLIANHKDIEKRLNQQVLAKELIAKLVAAEDFETCFVSLAANYSACSSKEKGGRLGEISAGQTVKEFERQVFLLDSGFCCNPIETRYGYHIVDVEKKKKGKQLEYSMCLDKIRDYLTEQRHRQAISQYLHEQVERAVISGINLQRESMRIPT